MDIKKLEKELELKLKNPDQSEEWYQDFIKLLVDYDSAKQVEAYKKIDLINKEEADNYLANEIKEIKQKVDE